MRTQAVIFPFDLFGSGGTAAGAQLLGDALREIIDDTKLEPRPVRQHAFAKQLVVREIELGTMKSLANWRSLAEEALKTTFKQDFTLWITGNHLGCLPIYNELEKDTLIIQFDAHLDCYVLHDTHATLSNGNFLLHLEKSKSNIINIGHRDLFLDSKTISAVFRTAISAESLSKNEIPEMNLVSQQCNSYRNIWIDIDADVFDPSICPAVHDPLPCGLMVPQFLKLIEAIDMEKIRGVSISEFDPGRDVRDVSLNLLGWLLEWLLLKKYKA